MALKGNRIEETVVLEGHADGLMKVMAEYVDKMSAGITAFISAQQKVDQGTHKAENNVRQLIQTFQKMTGELRTIETLYDSIANRGRTDLLSGLNDQAMGRKVLAASKLKRELAEVGTVADTLATRLSKLEVSLANNQSAARPSMLKKVDQLKDAAKEIDQLERKLKKFDEDARFRGGYSSGEFSARGKAQAELNELRRRANDGRVFDFSSNIAGLRAYTSEAQQAFSNEKRQLRELARLGDKNSSEKLAQIKAEERAAQARDKFEADRRKKQRAELAQTQKALVPADMRSEANRIGAGRTLARAIDEQAAAERRLADATDFTRKGALQSLDLANRRVTAAKKLVNEEERLARQEASKLRVTDGLAFKQQMGLAKSQVPAFISQAKSPGVALKALEMDQERALGALERANDDQSRKDALEQLRLAERRLSIGRQIVNAKASEKDADAKLKQTALDRLNMSEAELRSLTQRGASKFKFTDDQARGFNMRQVNRDVDVGITRLQALQAIKERALSGPSQVSFERMERWNRIWERITRSTSEAEAKQRAYNNLPEQKSKRSREAIQSQIFGDGGLGFGLRVAGIAAVSGVAYGVIGAVQQSAQYVVQLEDELNKLQAISGATDGEMRKLAGSIKEVGNNSRFSTLEIAQGATTIAQAGFSAAETANVLRSSLDLAAASGSSPAESIDLMTSALGAFNLQASESARVADVITAGLNKTKLGVEQIRLAIQYVGATAKENSVSLNELVAVTGLLANAGVRGSTAGTGLRQLLVDLKTPTEKLKDELKAVGLSMADIDVKSLGLAEVVRRLDEAGFSAEAAYEGLEVRAAASFLALRGQIDGYNALSAALLEQGAAADSAREASKGLSAQWTELKNTLGSVLSTLASGPVNVLTVLIDALGGVAEGINAVITGLSGLGEGAGRAGGVIESTLTTALTGAAVGGAIGGLPGAGVGGLLGALAGLFAGLVQAGDGLDYYREKSQQSSAALDEQRQTVSSVDDAIENLIQRSSMLIDNSDAVQAETLTLTQRFAGLNLELRDGIKNFDDLLAAMQRLRRYEARKEAVAAVANAQDLAREANAQGRSYRERANIFKTRAYGRSTETTSEGLKRLIPEAERLLSLDATKVDQTALGALLNRMTALESENIKDKAVIEEFREAYQALQEFRGTRAELALKNGVVRSYNTSVRTGTFDTREAQDEIRRDTTQGFLAEKDTVGSGSEFIERARRNGQALVDELKQRQARFKADSEEYRSLATEIRSTEALLKDIDRQEARVLGGDDARDKPGSRLTVAQIANQLERALPGARITDTTRSAGRQAGYDRAAGIKRDPNKAPHVAGNALDMAPLRGVDPLEVVALLEDMGLEVTGAPVKGVNGVRYISPDHGTARHWHFEWKPKTTQFERRQASSAEAAARELEQLIGQRSQRRVGAATSSINAILENAKAGIRPVSELGPALDAAIAEYRAAKLEDFDLANPTAGKSGAGLTSILEARKSLEAQLVTDGETFLAKYYRAISDNNFKALDVAFKQIEADLSAGNYAAEAGIRAAEVSGKLLSNDANRYIVGAGDIYRQEQDEKEARAVASQLKEVEYNQAILAQKAKLAEAEAELNQIRARNPDSPETIEEYNTKQAQVLAWKERITATERELNEVLAERQAREGLLQERPLQDRLQDAARAWQQNSGALDGVDKTLQNNVGPFLDTLSSGFENFFTVFTDGSKSFKMALGDMLRSFIQFVQQMILRALALYVVNQILGAFVPGRVKGISPGAAAGASAGFGNAFNGGLVIAQGRALGGITHMRGGGRVNRGSPFRDSALYNLAAEEFVVRRKAVKDLGLPFMEAINKHGRKGAERMMGAGSAFMNIQQPRQETNVYVVADKQEAGLGPNDVLVTIHRDILQNGPTKQLIRQVAQGG